MRYIGWGARIRTWEWRNQNPLPYHLATPQERRTILAETRQINRQTINRKFLTGRTAADKFDVVAAPGTDTRMLAFEGETLRLPSVDGRIPPSD